MRGVKKIFSYVLSILFYVVFGIFLLIFDPIQRICLLIFGYKTHKGSVDLFNLLSLRSLHILGTTYDIEIHSSIPNNVPIIIVANHQSMWDIPPIIWFLRKYHPKFISKIELGRKIPTISYNLRKGGSVLIDRKDPRQAALEIRKIARYVQKLNRSVVIFPEGTRSRTGAPKPFRRKGLLTLFKYAPDAYVLPVSISNSYKLQQNGAFPIPLGTHFKMFVHPSLKISEYDTEELIDIVETTVTSKIEQA